MLPSDEQQGWDIVAEKKGQITTEMLGDALAKTIEIKAQLGLLQPPQRLWLRVASRPLTLLLFWPRRIWKHLRAAWKRIAYSPIPSMLHYQESASSRQPNTRHGTHPSTPLPEALDQGSTRTPPSPPTESAPILGDTEAE